MQIEVDGGDILRSLSYLLDCSNQRLRWYMDTGDDKYMSDCKTYLDAANIYMNDICSKATGVSSDAT